MHDKKIAALLLVAALLLALLAGCGSSAAGTSTEQPAGASSAAASSGSSASSGRFSAVPVRMLAAGGRFSSPTRAEIAEDGDPEYVVPVKKEQEAIPLIRSLLSELSASARASLQDVLLLSDTPSGSHSERSEESPFPTFLSIPGLLSSAASAAAPVVQQTSSNNVSAPVNIHVESSAADPEAIGRSIYDTAERYLLRTLQSAV